MNGQPISGECAQLQQTGLSSASIITQRVLISFTGKMKAYLLNRTQSSKGGGDIELPYPAVYLLNVSGITSG